MSHTLNDIVKKTCATIKKYIFKRMSEAEKFEENPKLAWGEVVTMGLDEKAKRLIEYTKAGIFTPEEIKDYAIESEKL